MLHCIAAIIFVINENFFFQICDFLYFGIVYLLLKLQKMYAFLGESVESN
jgi:hypothetical protein